jgi:DnaJ like chaperone protein
MRYTGKLAGGLLGFVLGFGPVGAVLGALIGHQFDVHAERREAGGPAGGAAAVGERFSRATFRVMGCLAKADGHVSEQEIAAARAVMGQLGLTGAQVHAAIEHFTAGKQPDFDLQGQIAELNRVCLGRPHLMRVFLELQIRAALAGNDLDGPVRPLLRQIAARLGISAVEFAHIEAALRAQARPFGASAAAAESGEDLERAYRVLGVAAADSDRDIIKAYRRQLSRHHPDKLKANGLPDSMLEHAKQRTQQIIEAYELIRERRRMQA